MVIITTCSLPPWSSSILDFFWYNIKQFNHCLIHSFSKYDTFFVVLAVFPLFTFMKMCHVPPLPKPHSFSFFSSTGLRETESRVNIFIPSNWLGSQVSHCSSHSSPSLHVVSCSLPVRCGLAFRDTSTTTSAMVDA